MPISFRQLLILPSFLFLAPGLRAEPSATDFEKGREQFMQGDYAAAAKSFDAALPSSSLRVQAAVWRSRCLEESGEYARAREFLKTQIAAGASAQLFNRLGEMELRLGNFQEAKKNLLEAYRLDPRDLSTRLNLAVVQWHGGERTAARGKFLTILDDYRRAADFGPEQLVIAARAAVYLEREEDANRLFQQATRLEPANWTLYIPWGELFLEKYNTADARSVFDDALKSNRRAAPALLGLARCTAEQDVSAAIGLVHQASGINPHSPAAIALLGELLLAMGDEKSAAAHIDRLRREHPLYVSGIALSAMLADRNNDAAKRDQLCREAVASNRFDGEVYLRLGEDSARRYLFRDSVEHFRRALEIDPENWQAHAGLGISLSRLADEKGAREHLETAFKHNPFNVLVGNMLNLFDEMASYDTVRTAHFILRMSPTDKAVIGRTAGALSERAYAAMAPRYNVTVSKPVVVEIFPSHDDFAVRCFGLPGAQFFLGICFGPLITMNSPRARERGSFNWQETLWHEIAHVLHLQLTENRLPRWLAEGISGYEAARANPAWDMNMELPMAQAFSGKGKPLLPLRDLDGGFTKDPQTAILAYYQASQIIWFIEEKHGFQKVLDLLAQFRRGAKTAEAVQSVLDQTPEAFDTDVHKFLSRKFSKPEVDFSRRHNPSTDEATRLIELRRLATENPKNFFAQLQYGSALLDAGKFSDAERYLRQARELFPAYVEEGNTYTKLAALYEKQNRRAEAIAQLEAMLARAAKDVDAAIKLAGWHLDAKNYQRAAAALDVAISIFPYDVEIQRKRGMASMALNKPLEASRAFAALLALDPPDRAEAHCLLAEAYLRSGHRKQAKSEAVAALEIAPQYDKALEILMQAVE
jgi:tetratricopeptide (TPR) repeat protein